MCGFYNVWVFWYDQVEEDDQVEDNQVEEDLMRMKVRNWREREREREREV
jgi:hypothetical protein